MSCHIKRVGQPRKKGPAESDQSRIHKRKRLSALGRKPSARRLKSSFTKKTDRFGTAIVTGEIPIRHETRSTKPGDVGFARKARPSTKCGRAGRRPWRPLFVADEATECRSRPTTASIHCRPGAARKSRSSRTTVPSLL